MKKAVIAAGILLAASLMMTGCSSTKQESAPVPAASIQTIQTAPAAEASTISTAETAAPTEATAAPTEAVTTAAPATA